MCSRTTQHFGPALALVNRAEARYHFPFQHQPPPAAFPTSTKISRHDATTYCEEEDGSNSPHTHIRDWTGNDPLVGIYAMNPRVEEVSDSDSSNADSDPEEVDIDDVTSLIAPRNIPAATASSMHSQMLQPQSPAIKTSTDRDKSKHYQCLYPIYFDKARTRAEGRRVGPELAVENPLAREMADAAANLGLRTVFEPDKTHPKDWANPGRVRVLLKQDGKLMDEDVKNKHHLYILVSQYLKANPTQKTTPFRLPIAGIPMPKEMPEPAIPNGWKMSKILPLHSPALTGGGVSENFLQDMMAEMQGEIGGGSGAGSGAETKKKKDKKKK